MLPIGEYVRRRVPSAFFFETPSALLPLIVRAAPTVFEVAAQRAAAPGDRLRDASLPPEGQLAGVGLCIALAAMSAGLERARLVSPGDAFNEKTGTLAPVAFFSRNAAGHDVTPDIVRLSATYRHALMQAAADDDIPMEMLGRDRVAAGGCVTGVPCGTDRSEEAWHVSNASSEVAHAWGRAGRAVAAAARGDECKAAAHDVSRVIANQVLTVCVARGRMAETLADAWQAHGAAAELPLHARASVAVPWGLQGGEGCAMHAWLSEGARLQGVIEEFSAVALPVLRRAWDEVGQAGAWSGAADGVFTIPLGISSDDASVATTERFAFLCLCDCTRKRRVRLLASESAWASITSSISTVSVCFCLCNCVTV